jgi:hypothetical protein
VALVGAGWIIASHAPDSKCAFVPKLAEVDVLVSHVLRAHEHERVSAARTVRISYGTVPTPSCRVGSGEGA